MEIQISVAKTRKYAVSSSGDTVEVIERPHGGMSVVLADGQSSGKGAKWISTLVVRKVITLLSEGVRDGAAARAASDSLFTDRGGKVSATLNILSVDSLSSTVVITRNNPAPVIVVSNGVLDTLDVPSSPIGLYRDTRPVISQVPIEIGLSIIMFTDGIIHAGDRYGKKIDITTNLNSLIVDLKLTAEEIADKLLALALDLDKGRPSDDISVVVLQVTENIDNDIRRMKVCLPLEYI